MGQSLKKLAPGSEEKRAKEIGPIIETCYDEYFHGKGKDKDKDESKEKDMEREFPDFYQAVSEIINEINKKLGSTQFRVPSKKTMYQAFHKHYKANDKELTKEEFEKILKDVMGESGFTGIGAKDLILYIFGVPMTTLLIKQGVVPKAIPNEIFIPVVTSVTAFVLAKLNKI